MTYSLKNSAQTTTYTVNDNTENSTSTSLIFIGKNYSNYGLALNENFLYLLENFSNIAGAYPSNPVSGQLFWDNTNKYMHVYDGGSWKVIYGALNSLTVNTSIIANSITASAIGNSATVFSGVSANFVGGVTSVGQSFNANPVSTDAGRIFAVYNLNYMPGASYSPSDNRIFDFGVTTGNIAYVRTNGSNGVQWYTAGNGTSFNNALLPLSNTSINLGSSSNYWNNLYVANVYGAKVTGASINAANVYTAYSIANTATYSAAYYYANGLAFQGGVSSISAGTGVSVSSGTGAVTVSIGQAVGTGSTPTFAGLTSSAAIVPSSNASVDLGSTSAYWNNVYGINFFGTSTTAKYADLAEKYLPDAEYEVGTVMMVGGSAEVTQHSGAKVRAIGVISVNPAYKMNSDLDGGVYIALKGRVPVKVVGPVTKGQSLIGTAHGLAVAQTDDSQWMFAIALQDYSDSGIGLIEAVIL